MVLTVSGVGVALAGGAALLELGVGIEGIIIGCSLMGVGGGIILSGVVPWVIGSMRRKLARSGGDQAQLKSWSRAGMIVFLSGTGASVLGGSLLAASSRLSRDELFYPGFTMLLLGSVAALLVGLPMWIEPLRGHWKSPHANVELSDPMAVRRDAEVFARWLPAAILVAATPVVRF